ncbi:flagellar export protein FliJ [Pengzhenrongella sp.]|jgi:flagellar FliJ protein|uniref:flagellar export protein FliJ n=1 Tax=Pengzhenrongella sp. TaxID=2888820 RepID=UPI002F93D26B
MERAFRLAGLLRLRRLQEDQAAARLASANAALRSAQAHRDARAVALADALLPDGDQRAFGRAVVGRTALRFLLVEAIELAAGAREVAQVSTTQWQATRSRSVGLEKLEDKHVLLVRYEDDRTEQIVLDEIAGSGAARARRVAQASGGGRPMSARTDLRPQDRTTDGPITTDGPTTDGPTLDRQGVAP